MELRQRSRIGLLEQDAAAVMLNMSQMGGQSDGDSENRISVREVQAAAGEEMKAGYLDKKCISIFDGLMPELCDCRRKWKLNRFIIVAGGSSIGLRTRTAKGWEYQLVWHMLE